jgi:hypothetical protein
MSEGVSITILLFGLIIVIIGIILYYNSYNWGIFIILIGLFFMILSIFLMYYLRPSNSNSKKV